MSRSRKKRPGGGIAAPNRGRCSDKPFKVHEHRAERRYVRATLQRGEEPPPKMDFGNPWGAPKDGKQYWIDHDDRWMRK